MGIWEVNQDPPYVAHFVSLMMFVAWPERSGVPKFATLFASMRRTGSWDGVLGMRWDFAVNHAMRSKYSRYPASTYLPTPSHRRHCGSFIILQ
jgi:hypothetical protein